MRDLYSLKSRRYIGSKYKITDWILSHISNNCDGNTFFDIFAGTGIVSARAAKIYKNIILNDILYSNYVIYDAFFKSKKASNKLSNIIEKYNEIDLNDIKHNYFSKNFGGKFFSVDNSKLIGFIREDIENNKKTHTSLEYHTLLASLIYSADRVANTVGHYDAYIKDSVVNKKLCMKNIEPVDAENTTIYRKDSNLLAKRVVSDIVYIDPPYNSRQYERFYHILENLTKWEKPELHGVALKPEPENSSEYCKVKAPIVFADLINKLKCRFIAVSYNNTYESKSSSSRNKIKLDEINNILGKKGETKIFNVNHKYFNSGKTSFNNHQEYLFITKSK